MDVRLLINGEDVSAANGATFERKSPVTGKVVSRAASAQRNDVIAAADAASAAFEHWSSTGPGYRRALLLAASDIMLKRTNDFVELVVQETGATPGWAHFNVVIASGMLREAAAMTTQITGEVIPSDKPGCLSMALREPAGVVLGIAPWNAPIILAARAIAMPLACGNTVILKASEMCPGSHRLLGDVMKEAGFPNGVVNVVTNAPDNAAEVVESLIAHPAVRRINFTGSTRIGRIIAKLAAEHLKPTLLELGGKASIIILADADIPAAVAAVAFGSFMNQGQICMSTERVIVEEGIADEFVAQLAAKATSLRSGDPMKEGTVLGALVNDAAATHVRELIRNATEAGALLCAGGEGEKTIMPATVLDRVSPRMRIYSEESFGPVVSVVRAKNADLAIQIANDSEYGLSSAVFSRDISRALSIAKKLKTGICHINGPTVHDEPQMPFGGTKASGYGRFGGRAAIAEFTELRWITIDTAEQHYPI